MPEKVNGNLKADRVTYYYSGQNTAAVQQATVTIKQGSFVVIVGSSGSEKVRLVNYFVGWIIRPNGRVFSTIMSCIPSIQLPCELILPWFRRTINGTLYENIRGAVDASQEDVIAAAKAACIWDEIAELPMKLHTLTELSSEHSQGRSKELQLQELSFESLDFDYGRGNQIWIIIYRSRL